MKNEDLLTENQDQIRRCNNLSLRNPAQEDKRTYRSVEITEVEEFQGNYLCTGRNGFLFWVFKEDRVQPTVGEIATFYDEDISGGTGWFTRGLFIGEGAFQNDSKCFYSKSGVGQTRTSSTELDQNKLEEVRSERYPKIYPERARLKEENFGQMKDKLNKQYERLPEFFQNVIIGDVREESPGVWKKFGNQEVFLAREATKIALVVPVKGAMELWRNEEYFEIESAIQDGLEREWDNYDFEIEPRFSIDEHSTETFRRTIGSASMFATDYFRVD